MDHYQFKIAKTQAEFVWHSHPKTDEAFIVLQGKMQIQDRHGVVNLEEGEIMIVPKRIEHKPVTENECHILMIELAGPLNTGDAGGGKTIEEPTWI